MGEPVSGEESSRSLRSEGTPQRTRDAVTCSVCGTTEDELPVTWSMQVSERGQMWLCDRCARDNIRSIEGKLDEAWW